jgi:hypothetical protein
MKKICIAILVFIFGYQQLFAQQISQKENKWLPYFEFDASKFKNPPLEFGPFMRWWWPGNDVTAEELKREINLFADNSFGGVEIQTLFLGAPMGNSEAASRVFGWDTPSYYENVKVVMEEAKKRGVIVDMTNGSGWPTGGSYLSVDDSFLTLASSSVDVKGDKPLTLAIPTVANNTGVPSKFVALLAAKPLSEDNSTNDKTVKLDPASTIILTEKITGDSLYWNAPEGEWKIIAFWSKPNSTSGSMTASRQQGPILDHLDSTKVIKNYDYLFGQRTGIEAYYGNPLRAIFTDSYEFAVDRHFSPDFLAIFKERRGYDITPWLPANMQKGYNYVSYKNPNAPPDYSFGSEDWRLRYDYDLTISELFRDHFIKASRNWTETRGLLFRNQCYGMNMDLIENAGYSSIPETESMLGKEVVMKIMTSGAHLYNRPVITSESVVFQKKAYVTTPLDVKLSVDKLFAAGVNQIIYHGVPYSYFNDETTVAGWFPFGLSYANFSSNLGEGNFFWKYQKNINDYIKRTQYLLRSGKSMAEVLIYFPFINVEGFPSNPEEIMTNGDIKENNTGFFRPSEKNEWAMNFYVLINKLEANGITWDWVNDASITVATLDADKNIQIRGNKYQALILADVPLMNLQTAFQINKLAGEGMNLLVIGDLPAKQPSYLDWEKNDKETGRQISLAVKSARSRHINNPSELTEWIKTLKLDISFGNEYSFIRQTKRTLTDGSRIHFMWNKSDQWQSISLNLDKTYKNAFWFDAENGNIIKVNDLKNASYLITPYGSIILFANTGKSLSANILSVPAPEFTAANELLTIAKWDIDVASFSQKNVNLFDWKDNEQLKFSLEMGRYRSTFNITNLKSSNTFFVDLGKVGYTAEVFINGQFAGNLIYPPYTLEISKYLKEGENSIEVNVTPSLLNNFIGEANKGNNAYSAFKGTDKDLMSEGLIGPVRILKK